MLRWPLAEDLEMRLLEPRHAEEVYAVVDANRDHLHTWLPWVEQSDSPAMTRGFLAASLLRFAEQETMLLGIWWRAEFAGAVEGRRDPLNHSMDIGYWLAKKATGRGIMTRACHALTTHAFEDLGLHRVQIRCAIENEESAAVARRLGFVLEGTLRGALQVQSGRYVDCYVFGMVAALWAG